ncbi:MAG TPA: GNAT family N-acetyltransferase [Bacteroidales bacterium]|nr:GNAT family N-acetyltransferase [Bacteroidales bacterium]
MSNNVFSGNKISLRPLEPEDLELLYQWENEVELWPVSETLSPISKYILKKYLADSHKDIFQVKQQRLIIDTKENSESIGTIDLYDFDPFHKRAAVGILVAVKNQRRKGFAIEALGLLVNYCFDILKLHQVYCFISVDNKASLELFEKAGFIKTATKKEWNWNGDSYTDQVLMQYLNPAHYSEE